MKTCRENSPLCCSVLWLVPPGVSDELCVPGALDVCPAVSAASADGLQCVVCVGVCDGGVQDDVSAQSHQATGVFLQLHSCESLQLTTLGLIHQLLQTAS